MENREFYENQAVFDKVILHTMWEHIQSPSTVFLRDFMLTLPTSGPVRALRAYWAQESKTDATNSLFRMSAKVIFRILQTMALEFSLQGQVYIDSASFFLHSEHPSYSKTSIFLIRPSTQEKNLTLSTPSLFTSRMDLLSKMLERLKNFCEELQGMLCQCATSEGAKLEYTDETSTNFQSTSFLSLKPEKVHHFPAISCIGRSEFHRVTSTVYPFAKQFTIQNFRLFPSFTIYWEGFTATTQSWVVRQWPFKFTELLAISDRSIGPKFS